MSSRRGCNRGLLKSLGSRDSLFWWWLWRNPGRLQRIQAYEKFWSANQSPTVGATEPTLHDHQQAFVSKSADDHTSYRIIPRTIIEWSGLHHPSSCPHDTSFKHKKKAWFESLQGHYRLTTKHLRDLPRTPSWGNLGWCFQPPTEKYAHQLGNIFPENRDRNIQNINEPSTILQYESKWEYLPQNSEYWNKWKKWNHLII